MATLDQWDKIRVFSMAESSESVLGSTKLNFTIEWLHSSGIQVDNVTGFSQADERGKISKMILLSPTHDFVLVQVTVTEQVRYVTTILGVQFVMRTTTLAWDVAFQHGNTRSGSVQLSTVQIHVYLSWLIVYSDLHRIC